MASAIKKLDSIENIDDALREAGLFWDVRQEPLMTCSGIDIPSHKSIVREDTNKSVGVVTSGYGMIQNSVGFSAVDEAVQQYGGEYVLGASFDEGSSVMLQAKLNKSFTVGSDDKVDMYMTMINSHDGSGSFKMMVTPIRLFCMNQLNNANKHALVRTSVKHTMNAALNIAQMRLVFNDQIVMFDNLSKHAAAMHEKMVTSAMVDKFLDHVIGMPNINFSERQYENLEMKREKVTELFERGKGNNGATVWDLYNGATEYATHYVGSDENRMRSNLISGSALKIKTNAYNASMGLLR